MCVIDEQALQTVPKAFEIEGIPVNVRSFICASSKRPHPTHHTYIPLTHIQSSRTPMVVHVTPGPALNVAGAWLPCFPTADDTVLLSADYSQIEMR
jgi:hypothetical protein